MNGPRYKVAFTGLASEQLKAVVRRAESYDKPALFADAIRLLLEQLVSKPNEVGEPMYRLQSMKMDVRRVALAPVYLEYGVHRTEPLVIVRRVVGMAEPE